MSNPAFSKPRSSPIAPVNREMTVPALVSTGAIASLKPQVPLLGGEPLDVNAQGVRQFAERAGNRPSGLSLLESVDGALVNAGLGRKLFARERLPPSDLSKVPIHAFLRRLL